MVNAELGSSCLLLALLQAIADSSITLTLLAELQGNSEFPYLPLKAPNGVQLDGSGAGALAGGSCVHSMVLWEWVAKGTVRLKGLEQVPQ